MNGQEGRYADIIFEKKGTVARITDVKEGRRPVSGDRRIGVTITGCDTFLVDETKLSVSPDGYMLAESVALVDDESPLAEETKSREPVRVVVVVGLLHGNGVVDLLSQS